MREGRATSARCGQGLWPVGFALLAVHQAPQAGTISRPRRRGQAHADRARAGRQQSGNLCRPGSDEGEGPASGGAEDRKAARVLG